MNQTFKTKLILILFIIIITSNFFLSCAHYGDWGTIIDWEDIDIDKIPGIDEYPETGSIILLDKGSMDIVGSGKIKLSIFDRHKIIKILNPLGYKYANVVISYDSDSKVKNIQARTISPDGKITVLDTKNIYDINLYPNFIFYSDQRAKIFTMPAIENGSIIEYKYQIDISGYTFKHYWNFQEDVPSISSQFTLITPSEWDVDYRVYGIDLEPEIIKTPHGFKSTYKWKAKNIPAFKSEFGMPSKNELAFGLALSPIGVKTWQDVAKWYHELSYPHIKAGSEVKKMAHTLTDGVDSNKEKLRIIYEWVRDRIRYIVLSIGIGGYKPHPSDEVLTNRYGDCKDVTTLLCSMAREVGIDVNFALISTWQNGMPDTSLPSYFHFNHVIAFCNITGDSTIWMDATAKVCPFGKLPWYDQGLPILAIDKEGYGKIITTPRTRAENNKTIIDWSIKLQQDNSAHIHGKSIFYGANAIEIKDELYHTNPDIQREWLEVYLANRCHGVVLDSFQIFGLNPSVDSLSIHYTFYTNSFITAVEREAVFCPGDILIFNIPNYFRSKERTHPIQFRYGTKTELYLDVNLPDDWICKSPALSDSIMSDFGKASWSTKTDENNIFLNFEYILNGNKVEPDHYKNFQNFLDNVNKRNLQEIVIKI
jgi:hypothetical protein